MKGLTQDKWLKIHDVAIDLRVNPYHLATVICFETAGSFSPSKKAARSSGIGLLQFMPDTLEELGFSTLQASRMDFDEQLETIGKKYIRRWLPNGTAHLADLYMAVFCPKARNWPLSGVCYSAPSSNYEANSGLDRGKKGFITKDDCFQHLIPILKDIVDFSVRSR